MLGSIKEQQCSRILPDSFEGEITPLPEGVKLDGMERVYFPAGAQRKVHVNRRAIGYNANGDNYPTSVVIDHDGTKHNFHAVVIDGKAALINEPGDPDAAVHLLTKGKIVGYIDPAGQMELPDIMSSCS